VFGEGHAGAPLMLVGEQPGDKEELAGREREFGQFVADLRVAAERPSAEPDMAASVEECLIVKRLQSRSVQSM
jgi:hypothetical protein